ncbi:MAG: lytic transglycosylase domain-containing protein [Candidatus Kaiserbacteria bacterium]|nr:lytic transglycosylase domain-containing protein [Candidatus Kaiserbacteria bacterium]
MNEGIPKQSLNSDKEPKLERSTSGGGNGPTNLSRRNFLIGGAALLGSALVGTYFVSRNDESISEEKPPFPTPEKMHELDIARGKVRTCVESIRKRPFMEKPTKAKEALEHVPVSADRTSVALGLEEDGVMKTLHIQNIQELAKQLRNGKGAGVYVHRDGDSRYHVSLEDTAVDIGVSNRFDVRKHLGNGSLSDSLPVYAVKRSRYEKKLFVSEVLDKKNKKKIEKKVTGDYVEYVTYTPPAEHLVSKEIVGSGKEYVSVVLESAHTVLSHRMTQSNQKVLKICHDICKRLAIVEHVDPIALVKAEKKEGKETDAHVEARRKAFYQKMYAEYGLNQDTSFNHLINSVGAGGMMQIMRKTYTDIRARLIVRKIFLPDEIPEDANEGRRDPLMSAIIALYLCYDNYLVKGKTLSRLRDDEIELALVSMYNGSPNLFRKIFKEEKPKKEKKSKKGKNKNIPRVHSPSVPYPNATPFIQKLLSHDEGAKLPGSGESENRNYLRKYLWLKMNEGKI